MDKFEIYVEIRGMLNQKYSISTIARKLNISRNTVYKYIRKSPEEMAEWTASTMIRSKKLDIYMELILHWLREFPDLTAAQVQDWLKEKYPEFKVGESTVRSYVRCLREDYQIPKESSTRDYQAVVFVNINLSQSDHFKNEPLHSELFPYLEGDWEFRVSCPSGQDTLNSSCAQTTGRSHPFVSYFV
ncbi:Helix-turn-helix domain of resolvase [Bacillus sp. OV166]|uniref:helix-turn-helix domain-containing protein n=1 Tax=Bacillus sp. OV166 TaxID=1882763 RepID=UPI000A2ACD9C|nr:helix-turn-helix domain-containing protein [Bacillus sp. OV166]SMQ85064.1 Helix-turn-helix domain of resolvase [Bacillus sp. OV166]